MKQLFIPIVFILSLLASTPSSAKLYKCTDQKGKIYYTDLVCPNESAKKEMKEDKNRSNLKKINKNGISILDWTNRLSGSGTYFYIEGILKNTSKKRVSRIRVKVKSLNSRGQLVSLDDGYADPTSLYPEGEATFQIMVRNTSEIEKFSLSVIWE